MLRIQPESTFAAWICDQLSAEKGSARRWSTFELAVAWINEKGAKRIEEHAADFLTSGQRIRTVVGLDFGSTTVEGLRRLLALEAEGADIKNYVFFDENRACTFHPKVFMFRNADRALLAVGSNNLTGAGLNTNIEAALILGADLEDSVISSAITELAKWRDTVNEPRSKLLTEDLLTELQDEGYVLTEAELRSRRRSEGGGQRPGRKKLFGRSQTGSDPTEGDESPDDTTEDSASVSTQQALLMRVRPRRNGRQIQVSLRILEGFMQDADEVVAQDGSRREIGYNMARGVPNTARFEAPEMENMANPVARFLWIEDTDSDEAIRFEIFDADHSEIGARIFTELREGIRHPPETDLAQLSASQTVVSISDVESAQWYRLSSSPRS